MQLFFRFQQRKEQSMINLERKVWKEVFQRRVWSVLFCNLIVIIQKKWLPHDYCSLFRHLVELYTVQPTVIV